MPDVADEASFMSFGSESVIRSTTNERQLSGRLYGQTRRRVRPARCWCSSWRLIVFRIFGVRRRGPTKGGAGWFAGKVGRHVKMSKEGVEWKRGLS